MTESLANSRGLGLGAAAFLTVGLGAAIYVTAPEMPPVAKGFMIGWLALSLVVTLAVPPRNFVAGFSIGLFALLVGWRIAGIYDVDLVTYPLLGAFVCFVFQFFNCAYRNVRPRGVGPDVDLVRLSIADWHLAFIRLYVGLDLVPHFTEKLFAGPGPHMDDVNAFAQLGVPSPDLFVWLAGLCEFGAAIGVGLGFLTRLAAAGSALYILIATILGNHFLNGFIWASPGGGWEFPVVWAVLLLSFIYVGGGRFSLDHALLSSLDLPAWSRKLMTRESG